MNPSCINLFLTNNGLSFQHTETFSTGLSDFHKLVLTVLNTTVLRNNQKELHYRNYKKFNFLKFNADLKNAFAHDKIESCIKFDEVFMRHTPLRKKVLRANHLSYISKTLRKAIKRRSYLEKKYKSVLEPTKTEILLQ